MSRETEAEGASSYPAGPQLILGLGNPGAEYRDTPHNVGFSVARELVRRRGWPAARLECSTLVAGSVEDGVLVGMPQTYMNRSGAAARCLVERLGARPERMLVVLDDVNLPLGRLRLRREGSAGGHRGLESVLEQLRTDQLPRLRLGVATEPGPSGEELVDYVLTPFPADQRDTVRTMVERGADCCEAWLREGIEEAMNRFNG